MFKKIINAAWFWFARLLCRVFCLVFFRMRFNGLENIPAKGAFVLAVNHQSFLDPLFAGIAAKRHLCFMARDTLFKHWFFGRLIASVNAIPVRRGRADISSIKTIISRLKEGRGICLFPEATRSTDGKIAPFKGGFTLLCRRGNAPVIPVLIDGAFECWPRHKKLFKPGSKITVSYGPPISLEKITSMPDDDFAKLLTDTLRTMQSQIRLKSSKQPFNYA
jgi:1-acyl-sn-glycerol-3-phosphate acyltransferase